MVRVLCTECGSEQEFDTAIDEGAVACSHCHAPLPSTSAQPPVTISLLRKDVEQELSQQATLTRYEMAEEIAQGGMGSILRAFDPALRREMAVKVVREESNTEQQARLLEEAQVTGQLEHPNIVPIHDMGRDASGKLFFTMKMVRGRSLEQVLDGIRLGEGNLSKRYTMPRLLQVLAQVCNAVAFAHSQGVIHRDLKPGNIMLGDFGEVLVMDWGLAKLDRVRHRPESQEGLNEEPAPAAEGVAAVGIRQSGHWQESSHRPIDLSEAVKHLRKDSKLWGTRQGTIAGTPAYMSPEQARGELDQLDERSDIYALGTILYEILTLHPPVLGSTESQIVKAVVEDEIVPPERRAPSRRIPQELSAIAMRALSKDPEQRYQSVPDLQRDLRAFLDGLTIYRGEANIVETLIRLGRHYKGHSFIAGLITSALIGLGVYSYMHEFDLRQRAEERARRISNEQENNRLRAQNFVREAREEYQVNRVDEALSLLDRAIAADPRQLEARLLRAQLLELRQEYELALSEIETYLKFKPNDDDALRMAQRYRKALKVIEPSEQP